MNMNEKVIHSGSIALRIRTIVEEASVRLLLISPYLDPWNSLQKSILNAAKKGVECMIIIRSNETIKEGVKEKLLEFIKAGVKIRESERLHAKLYLSEKSIILTSMNLLESSATDSVEVGMEFTGDGENFRLLRKQAEDIVDHSKDRFTSTPPTISSISSTSLSFGFTSIPPTISNNSSTSLSFGGSSSSTPILTESLPGFGSTKSNTSATSKKCSRCGRDSHDASSCYASTHIGSPDLKKVKYNNEGNGRINSKDGCFRCGREGHYVSACYASTHILGYDLRDFEDDEDDDDDDDDDDDEYIY